ncbi:MAG: Mur ligase family protein [Parvibaculum sp.]|uniref:bifunctional folylpolyglutamate synthase/dihydrofolate synthase n=1 Tax=Parvibaculum sp. TaxID=2024848 RepID=UPI0027315EC6|nr:Mur ligase family protein [Parvibaculum sp.]MDP2151208.1 Mur ligase family protein [Parvibaculum sp.]
MSYREAVSALKVALTFGIHPSLEGIRALTAVLDHPQDAIACIQVTGTNGKSSVTRMIAALLRAEGFHVGAYTSPHLDSYTERIELGGAAVDEGRFASAITQAIDASQAAHAAGYSQSFTEFELLTAAALALFRDVGVDFAVLEVGMGGRWDATSVVDPSVSVVTGVALDHTRHLGSTREQIAADKAHIIKGASAPVLGPGTVGVEDVILRRADELDTHPRAVREAREHSPLAEEMTVRFSVRAASGTFEGGTRLDVDGLHGSYPDIAIAAPRYQAGNAAVAVAAAEAALGRPLDAVAVRTALASLRFPARFEVFRDDPPVVIDGSHNPEAAAVLADAITEAFGEKRPTVLLGVLADKDAAGIVRALAPVASSWAVTAPDSDRALPAEELAAAIQRETGAVPEVFPTIAVALATLLPAAAQGLIVTGSLTTAAEARRALAYLLESR